MSGGFPKDMDIDIGRSAIINVTENGDRKYLVRFPSRFSLDDCTVPHCGTDYFWYEYKSPAPDLIVHESFGSEEHLFCCSKGHECFVVPKCRNVLLFRNNPAPRLKFASDSGNPWPMGTSRYANRYFRAAPPLRGSGFSLAA